MIGFRSPQYERIAIGAWLGYALLKSLAALWLVPVFDHRTATLLLYLWLGHPLFLVLLIGWERRRDRLIDYERAQRLAREASEHRFRTVFDQSAAGMGLVGADADWLDVNPRLAELTGYSVAELLRLPLCELLPEAERDEYRDRLHAFLADPAAPPEYSVESPWLRKDGSLIWLSRHIRRLRPEPEQPARALLMALDISDRKRAEAAANAQREMEDFLFLQSPMALIEWTPEMRVRRWSRQAEEQLGWSSEEIVGRTLRETGLLGDEEADSHERVMQEFFSGQRDRIESLRKSRRKDGSYGWFRWFSYVLRDDLGAIRFFFTAGIDVTALREANDQLDERERRLRAIVDNAAVGIALLDERGRWLDVNPRICEITGYARGELLAIDFQTITHPEDLDADVELSRQVIACERPGYSIEKRYLRKGGGIVWIRLHVSRIDASGQVPMRFVSVVEDIGERKRLEAETAERRVRLDVFEDASPMAFIEWSPEFRIVRWSKQAEEIFGWREGEVLGRSPTDWKFVHEDLKDEVGGAVQDLIHGRRATVAASIRTYYHRDGHLVQCRVNTSALRNADGSIAAFLSLIEDVSEEQFALHALRDSEARFKGIFEQAAVGIALLDAESQWLMVNRRFCEMVGYSQEALLRRNCLEITEPFDRATEIGLRRRLVAGEIDDYQFEKRYVRADGSPLWVSVFARRLEQGEGQPLRLSLVVEDISARKESAAQLQSLYSELERKVAERTRQLQRTAQRWVERSQDLALLTEMTGVLPAARDAGEANRIVARYLPRLFKQIGGEVWIEEAERGQFLRQAHWNLDVPGPTALKQDDCWALRRGQALRIDDPNDPLLCPHGHDRAGAQQPHTCVPIVALGELIGLIHLRWSEWPGVGEGPSLPPDPALLASTAEQIGLAIGNVRLREELRRQATRDPLTGLFNRRHFDESLGRLDAEHRRSGRGFGLLMIDIDHFKAINDGYGHEAGDEVLRAVGARLQRLARAEESVFRIGGEEFVMLIHDDPATDLAACAERLRSGIEALPIQFRGAPLPSVTVSIGAARCTADAADAQLLVGAADRALYVAKRTGRNRVCYASPPPDHRTGVAVVEARSTRRRGRPPGD